ncbi:hypothetical protein Pr1d_16760 [Bythopirellula goksoeyrii]|uniref:Uncharacterized protein n=1 Tax=Bythopirellula goksoeyrii TaxID=1400387 RepID=A0A5B9Q9X6_9BACT|nr:hypothetical protein Pr1d_15960 [Bythopirellula goksoeyrii]QEG34400.1 hypothetical protein Pr1d_16760 [Bythopirellula goksoeyrii]
MSLATLILAMGLSFHMVTSETEIQFRDYELAFQGPVKLEVLEDQIVFRPQSDLLLEFNIKGFDRLEFFGSASELTLSKSKNSITLTNVPKFMKSRDHGKPSISTNAKQIVLKPEGEYYYSGGPKPD